MAIVGPSGILRPTSVSVFRLDPAGLGQAIAFLLENTPIPSDDSIRLDATSSETETHRWAPTTERMEAGAFATTGSRKLPEEFSVAGTLTATPLGVFAPLGTLSSVLRRDLSAYRRLLAIADLREPLIVICREAVFASMQITAITRTKTPKTGDAVDVSISFVEARIVSPATVIPLVDLESMIGGAASSANLGAQATPAASVPVDVAAGGFG